MLCWNLLLWHMCKWELLRHCTEWNLNSLYRDFTCFNIVRTILVPLVLDKFFIKFHFNKKCISENFVLKNEAILECVSAFAEDGHTFAGDAFLWLAVEIESEWCHLWRVVNQFFSASTLDYTIHA